ncbi:uncharacterized protein LOC103516027 isoform X1 [Diaphorina citri]|uniref:Uncharacterized protein LOC103516027 isoform X1 n=1 Tax=Diaphorina citri TaxID=121845 RepID=A0A1S3DCI7_DIACI|nr:uncharacterized protein LOC103516027 isoform X2 [Diaphorina citri]XP_017302386.1 uncharacterized protein LOC103516027 isoform X3 [Diaphorina citri]XP_026684350.1 uncharacterized protein LOC103516027 isoform X1 [Diaphorina citri]KAI5740282.1 hypothetical protein M8J76_002392 [Diaphorina citri]KAI5746713.1 hypothetical protein M8J77_006648 [Diaphorina citri]
MDQAQLIDRLLFNYYFDKPVSRTTTVTAAKSKPHSKMFAMFRQFYVFLENTNVVFLAALVLFSLTIGMSLLYLMISWMETRQEIKGYIDQVVNYCQKSPDECDSHTVQQEMKKKQEE